MQGSKNMKTLDEDFSDRQIILAIKSRLNLTQGKIASMFCVGDACISRALSGKGRLRPAVRRAMIALLKSQDIENYRGTLEVKTAD